jgi:hypothetical protein
MRKLTSGRTKRVRAAEAGGGCGERVGRRRRGNELFFTVWWSVGRAALAAGRGEHCGLTLGRETAASVLDFPDSPTGHLLAATLNWAEKDLSSHSRRGQKRRFLPHENRRGLLLRLSQGAQVPEADLPDIPAPFVFLGFWCIL